MTAPSSTPIEERLRAYGAQLDDAATTYANATRSTRTPPVTRATRAARRPTRQRLAVVLAVAAAVTIVALVIANRPEPARHIASPAPTAITDSSTAATVPSSVSTSVSSSVSATSLPVTAPPTAVPPTTTPSFSTTTTPGAIAGARGAPLGAWMGMPYSPLLPRDDASGVWTGTEYLVWGGHDGDLALSDGAAYNPTTATWRSIAPNHWAHPGAVAAWTGSQMVVLAKYGGATYDLATDTWKDLPQMDGSVVGTPALQRAIWTGTEILGLGQYLAADGQTRLGLATITPGDTGWVVRTVPDILDDDTLQIVPTSDGIVAWEFAGVTQFAWRYLAATDTWTKLPDIALPQGYHIDDSTAGWFAGTLVAVVTETKPDGTADSVTYQLAGDTWTRGAPMSFLIAGAARAVSTSEGVIVSATQAGTPVLVVPGTGWWQIPAYPFGLTASSSVATDGTNLFDWGGHDQSTGNLVTGGAIWLLGVGRVTGTVTDASGDQLVYPGTRVDVGCIDQTGSVNRDPKEWLTDTAPGAILLSGQLVTDVGRPLPVTTDMQQAAGARLPAYSPRPATEYSATVGSCVVYRGILFQAADGSSVKVSVFQLTHPANTSGLPQQSPFVWTTDDVMTSSSDQIGERSAVKVLADGTVIKVQASGVGADDFAGYPTTFPANPEAGPPQPAAQSIAQLTAIADAVANAVLAHR